MWVSVSEEREGFLLKSFILDTHFLISTMGVPVQFQLLGDKNPRGGCSMKFLLWMLLVGTTSVCLRVFTSMHNPICDVFMFSFFSLVYGQLSLCMIPKLLRYLVKVSTLYWKAFILRYHYLVRRISWTKHPNVLLSMQLCLVFAENNRYWFWKSSYMHATSFFEIHFLWLSISLYFMVLKWIKEDKTNCQKKKRG